jgi:monofunctional biosynthetic peptidoglycan transglycosylase
VKRYWHWAARAFLLTLAVVLLFQLWFFAQVVWLNFFNPSSSAFMDQRLEVLQEKNPHAKLRHKWVPYTRISSNLKRALVAAEDANFMEHEGFDWDAIQAAFEKNLKRGKVVAGGSTISQQLAKNLFLSSRRSAVRKLHEANLTLMIEAVMSKRRIFEIYLNIIEWGNGVYGAEAASRYYYKKSAASLDAWEAARMAAMVPNPRYYDRRRDTSYLSRKTNLILLRMPSAAVP